MAGIVGLYLSILLVGLPGWILYDGLRGEWHASSPGETLPIVVPMLVIGLVVLGAGIYLWWKGRQGEPV